MKHKRNALIKLLAMLLAVWMLAGCQQNGAWLGDEDEEDDDSPAQTQKADKVVHLTLDKTVEFVSDQTKESWRAPLEQFLAKLIPHLWDNEDMQDYSNPNYGSIAIALMDLNMDGTPEVLCALPGGSACNIYYWAYDLFTGNCLFVFDGGDYETWDYYYDSANDTFGLMGKFYTRGGAEEQHRHIVRIDYDAANRTYQANQILYGCYIESMSDGSMTTIYKVNGEVMNAAEYYDAAEALIHSHIRIADTQMQLIDWDEVATKEDSVEQRSKAMAEALLSSGQEFIKPAAKD